MVWAMPANDPPENRPAALSPRQGAPRGFVPHAFERTSRIEAPREHVWAWLNTPETFTRQIWPYRVEFVDGSGISGGGGFEPGVLNIHHGPLLNCPGVITEVDSGADGRGAFRDLQYYYGAFIISPRLIRPRRLRFWVEDAPDGGCALRLRVECDVRRWIRSVWTTAQRPFWASFYRWAARGSRRRSAAVADQPR